MTASTPFDLDTLMRSLRGLVRIPPAWLRIVLAMAVLSLFKVGWTQGEGFSLDFAVNNTTVIILATAWLPSVLQLFALVGGDIKTPVGELSTSGLDQILDDLNSETRDEVMGAVNVVLKDAETQAHSQERSHLKAMSQHLTQEVASQITPEKAREDLMKLAERYQSLQESPSGTKRNFLFEVVAESMQMLGFQARLSDGEITQYLQSNHQGQRLMALSCLEGMPMIDLAHFDNVLNAIAHPQSAFEQTNALRVIETMLPRLTPDQRQHLKVTINQQRDYDESQQRWIKPGSERWLLCDRILAKLS